MGPVHLDSCINIFTLKVKGSSLCPSGCLQTWRTLREAYNFLRLELTSPALKMSLHSYVHTLMWEAANPLIRTDWRTCSGTLEESSQRRTATLPPEPSVFLPPHIHKTTRQSWRINPFLSHKYICFVNLPRNRNTLQDVSDAFRAAVWKAWMFFLRVEETWRCDCKPVFHSEDCLCFTGCFQHESETENVLKQAAPLQPETQPPM